MTNANDAHQPLSDAAYRASAEAVMRAIEAQVDVWLQDDVVDIDVRRTGGMLELVLPGGDQVGVSMQPPLQELWLAAPVGGFHYRWDGQEWADTRGGASLFATLSHIASTHSSVPLRFVPPAH